MAPWLPESPPHLVVQKVRAEPCLSPAPLFQNFLSHWPLCRVVFYADQQMTTNLATWPSVELGTLELSPLELSLGSARMGGRGHLRSRYPSQAPWLLMFHCICKMEAPFSCWLLAGTLSTGGRQLLCRWPSQTHCHVLLAVFQASKGTVSDFFCNSLLDPLL